MCAMDPGTYTIENNVPFCVWISLKVNCTGIMKLLMSRYHTSI